MGSVELIIKDKVSRGTLHDEVSTIMRSSKVKDLTVQMSSVGSVAVPQIAVNQAASGAANSPHVLPEDDDSHRMSLV